MIVRRLLRDTALGALAWLAQALAELLRRHHLHQLNRRDRRTCNGRNT